MIYIVYPLLLALFFVGAKFYKNGTWNDEVMSAQQTNLFKGFIAVIILFHHLSQKVSAYWMDQTYYQPGLEFFVDLGFICVAFFFFFSGVGLVKSYENKPDYLNGFIKKRIMPIIVAFVTSELMFFIARLCLGERPDTATLICYLTGVKQTNPYIWYVYVIPFFYLCFYLAFKFCKTEGKAILVVWIVTIAYMLLGTMINHNDYLIRGEWWYNSIILFPIGMSFARGQDKIINGIKKRYVLWLILSFVLMIVLFYAAYISTLTFSYYYGENGTIIASFATFWRRWVCLILQSAEVAMACLFFVILRMKISLNNIALKFLSKITLEFYLIHGLFVSLFCFSFDEMGTSLYYITTPIIYVAVVVILSLLLSVPYKKINQLIYNMIFKKKKES